MPKFPLFTSVHFVFTFLLVRVQYKTIRSFQFLVAVLKAKLLAGVFCALTWPDFQGKFLLSRKCWFLLIRFRRKCKSWLEGDLEKMVSLKFMCFPFYYCSRVKQVKEHLGDVWQNCRTNPRHRFVCYVNIFLLKNIQQAYNTTRYNEQQVGKRNM